MILILSLTQLSKYIIHHRISITIFIIHAIGNLKEEDNLREKIFQLPHTTTAQKHLSRWISLAGIKKKITWHCSRHSFAVNLLNSGTDIKTVSSLLGHASIKMAEKYLHVIDSRK